MWMDCKTLAYSLYFCYLVWIKSICITTHRVFFFLDWLSGKFILYSAPLWMMEEQAGGKMGNLGRSGLILGRHYNQLQFNIPGLPAYPPTSRPGSKRETTCFDKEWISLRYFGFEARVQVGADGASSIISMLAHLPCLLIERTAFNWINCPVIYNIQRALCPLSIFPI